MVRLLILLWLAALPSSACLWDRDTLREEAKGKLDTVKAITGWFDRYPPHYYEMRLARVTEELTAKPEALDLYDDAGVACSRLGRHDEAIAWMEKKKAVLDSRPEEDTKDERYRYLSNAGTFYLLRWMSQPKEQRSADSNDLESSEIFIAQALEVNPDAHFGREKFQLKLIQWLLGKSPRSEDKLSADFLYPVGGKPGDFTPEEARKGITGLIELGAAWESVDGFHALARCLAKSRNGNLSYLAFLRQQELLAAGRESFQPEAGVLDFVRPQMGLETESRKTTEAYYRKARDASQKRHAAWISYQEDRFARGMHPDTNADFWKDWKEPAFPKMPGLTLMGSFRRYWILWLISPFVLLYLVQFLPKPARWRSRKLAASPIA